ncbi:MAG TPA: hypothetical protein VMF60_08040, partial [Acidimicrobiales bacterium]|nr:hypothetical protein [Acidimicrobiales bacterium]
MLSPPLRPGPRRRRRRPTVGPLLLAVVLGACSTNGTSATGSTTTTSTSASAADLALAQRELLPASAFPTGWKGQGSGSTNSDASFFGGASAGQIAQLLRCLGVSSTDVDPHPSEAGDQEYDDPDSNVTVTDTVDVFPTVAQATKDVESAANPKTPACVVQVERSQLEKATPAGAVLGTLRARRASLPSDGEHHAAVVVYFPFRYEGVST